jgi:hypothetical protein
MIPKQVGWCQKCGATFHTLRAFKKHLKKEEIKEEQTCNDLKVYSQKKCINY